MHVWVLTSAGNNLRRVQDAVEGLIRQVSALAAQGSRLCFDALHADYLDGRVKSRGFSCGSEVCADGLAFPVRLFWHARP